VKGSFSKIADYQILAATLVVAAVCLQSIQSGHPSNWTFLAS
jgi:hypothetical protein